MIKSVNAESKRAQAYIARELATLCVLLPFPSLPELIETYENVVDSSLLEAPHHLWQMCSGDKNIRQKYYTYL